MMVVNVVETSSVESLFVVVNNLWTLVAVVTAAVSFWRFRLVPSLTRLLFRLSIAVDSAETPTVISRPAVDDETMIPPEASLAAVIFREVDSDGGVVKGNRVYSRLYFDDVIVDEEEAEDNEGLVAIHEDETVRFDVSERLRLLDLGFYEYQDLRVLDGNVVRLWDS